MTSRLEDPPENGADPYIENDLGMNAFDICEKSGPFPKVHKAMLKHIKEKTVKKVINDASLKIPNTHTAPLIKIKSKINTTQETTPIQPTQLHLSVS